MVEKEDQGKNSGSSQSSLYTNQLDHQVTYEPVILLFQVEASLSQDDYGRDLASVQNLMKKHQLVEADIAAHEVSIKWMISYNVAV